MLSLKTQLIISFKKILRRCYTWFRCERAGVLKEVTRRPAVPAAVKSRA